MNNETNIPKNENSEHTPNYFLRRAAASAAILSIGAAGYGAGKIIEKVGELNEMHPISSTSVTLQNGESVIGAVEKEVETYFGSHKIDPGAIPYGHINEQSGRAADESKKIFGETDVQPGATFDILILKDKMGSYDVEVEPSQMLAEDGSIIPRPEFLAPTPDNPAR